MPRPGIYQPNAKNKAQTTNDGHSLFHFRVADFAALHGTGWAKPKFIIGALLAVSIVVCKIGKDLDQGCRDDRQNAHKRVKRPVKPCQSASHNNTR